MEPGFRLFFPLITHCSKNMHVSVPFCLYNRLSASRTSLCTYPMGHTVKGIHPSVIETMPISVMQLKLANSVMEVKLAMSVMEVKLALFQLV